LYDQSYRNKTISEQTLTGSSAEMKEIQSHDEGRSLRTMDAFEYMFEWAETSFCPAAMRNFKPESKPDTLDYVFDHVVCCSGSTTVATSGPRLNTISVCLES
jgi:hypothetical protein